MSNEKTRSMNERFLKTFYYYHNKYLHFYRPQFIEKIVNKYCFIHQLRIDSKSRYEIVKAVIEKHKDILGPQTTSRLSPTNSEIYGTYLYIYKHNEEFPRVKREPVGLVKEATESSTYPYTNLKSFVCDCCGKPLRVENAIKKEHEYLNDNYFYHNRWTVCKDKRCRAVAVFCRRSKGEFPLIKVLENVTKNSKNGTYKYRLEKHFIRHS